MSIPNLGALDVISSADLKAAVTRAVEARIFDNGQSCIAAKRFIVAELIADEFEGKFLKRMQDLRVRDPVEDEEGSGGRGAGDNPGLTLSRPYGSLPRSLQLVRVDI